jgi:hypothetical protein
MMHYLEPPHTFDPVDLDYNYLNSLKNKWKFNRFGENEFFYFIPRFGLSGTELSKAFVWLNVVGKDQAIPPGP